MHLKALHEILRLRGGVEVACGSVPAIRLAVYAWVVLVHLEHSTDSDSNDFTYAYMSDSIPLFPLPVQYLPDLQSPSISISIAPYMSAKAVQLAKLWRQHYPDTPAVSLCIDALNVRLPPSLCCSVKPRRPSASLVDLLT